MKFDFARNLLNFPLVLLTTLVNTHHLNSFGLFQFLFIRSVWYSNGSEVCFVECFPFPKQFMATVGKLLRRIMFSIEKVELDGKKSSSGLIQTKKKRICVGPVWCCFQVDRCRINLATQRATKPEATSGTGLSEQESDFDAFQALFPKSSRIKHPQRVCSIVVDSWVRFLNVCSNWLDRQEALQRLKRRHFKAPHQFSIILQTLAYPERCRLLKFDSIHSSFFSFLLLVCPLLCVFKLRHSAFNLEQNIVNCQKLTMSVWFTMQASRFLLFYSPIGD